MKGADYPQWDFSRITDADVEVMRRFAMRGHLEAIEDLALVAEIRGGIDEYHQWRHWLANYLKSSKGGRSRRDISDNHEVVTSEYDNLRRHVSVREDSRRISDALDMSFGTVRRIITKHIKKT